MLIAELSEHPSQSLANWIGLLAHLTHRIAHCVLAHTRHPCLPQRSLMRRASSCKVRSRHSLHTTGPRPA